MRKEIRRRFFSTVLIVALTVAMLVGASAETEDIMQGVRVLAWPYYADAILVAAISPNLGRDFTDHKTAHANMVREKAVEVGYAIQEAVALGTLGGEPGEGSVALNDKVDFMVLEGAALFHDTGMCGGGYAMSEAVDAKGSPMKDENGRTQYDVNTEGLYLMNEEEISNFAEIRTFHSLNSALYVLVNREGLLNLGYTDLQVDKMAAECMAHSKSNSGVRNLNSRADWDECFTRLESIVYAWNKNHIDPQISFDRTPFEADDALLGSLVSETLALRVGDVSRDSGPDAEVQTGELVYVDRNTLNDHGGSIPEEIKGAKITVGMEKDPVESQKSRQVHAGEQNISFNRTFVNEAGVVTHEITVIDGCSAPRCTQQSVDDHLGEFHSARVERFEVRVIFERFDAEDADYFRDSWEDFRVQAAQEYPGITICYPWDGEVSK